MKEEFGAEISSKKFTHNEICSIYNERKFEEYKDNELLSFLQIIILMLFFKIRKFYVSGHMVILL